MFDLLRRRQVLPVVELIQLLNQALRRASTSWRCPTPTARYRGLDAPADFQRPLAAAYHTQTEVLADVHELLTAARANLPDTVPGLHTQQSIARAAQLLGEAEIALRQAALATCPDADPLAARQR
ncbi:hypothetical protein [Kitasatospora sp. MBT66]|uniref:hypothetical protein n=1 Tax=Kitasatospora sp. MBT66 TaxID=1444769 RepID=UPI0005BAF085|nr:hypothetical protein [Kitasatospora sp. MBT66]